MVTRYKGYIIENLGEYFSVIDDKFGVEVIETFSSFEDCKEYIHDFLI